MVSFEEINSGNYSFKIHQFFYITTQILISKPVRITVIENKFFANFYLLKNNTIDFGYSILKIYSDTYSFFIFSINNNWKNRIEVLKLSSLWIFWTDFSQLKYLSIKNKCWFSSLYMENFTFNHPKLQVLKINSSSVDEMYVRNIRNCSNIEVLYIKNNNLADESIIFLLKLQKLIYLDVSSKFNIIYRTDEMIQTLEVLSNLKY
jgi:hypothetical protein